MANSYAIFGLGSFGSKLAISLSSLGNTVLVCDVNPVLVDEMRDKVAESVVADVSNLDVIKELNVEKFDVIILGMSSHFEDQILALTHIKQEGARHIIAKASSDVQERILYRLGADEVIQPEQDVANRLSRRLSWHNISDIFEFKGSAIAEVIVPQSLSGKTLLELDLRNRCNVTVLLLRKAGTVEDIATGPGTLLEKGDQLTVFGNRQSIIELFKED
ncbi:MAG: TrkA family potassium uptake protein [Lentisphaeria bacterium]|nr:TrkA family potassium uptake protein [Lentisphaeria bacterium]